MINKYRLEFDGCQCYSNIFDKSLILNLSKVIDDFIINEKIFHKIYHDPFYISKNYNMIYSSQLDGCSITKKTLIVINGRKCSTLMKSSFAILYPEYIFKDYFNEIVKIDVIYKLLEKITGHKWFLDNSYISVQIGCNERDEYKRKTLKKNLSMYIPLQNIKSLNDGPLAFIRFSHRVRKLSREYPCIMCPLNIGDFVLYFQNGLHKNGEQTKNSLCKIRKNLILNFSLLENKNQ